MKGLDYAENKTRYGHWTKYSGTALSEQDEVIAKLGMMGIEVSKSTYAKLETNRMNIKVSELVALSKIFGTDINAFFNGLI